MITLRRASKRHHSRRDRRDVWLTFHAEDRTDPLADGFGTLETLNEDRLPPGARVPLEPARPAEIITYVMEGAIAQKDSMSRCSVVIRAGEFQRMSAERDGRHIERNASRTDWVHAFRISLHPDKPGCQDASIYSAMLDPGQHLIHELSPGRRAWLHVVRGEVTLDDEVLVAGDGVGYKAERAVSFTARTEGEILLLDLGERPTSSEGEAVAEAVAAPERRDASGIDVWEAEGGA
jgi:redox-sensitive bicupin YhaK (pirin superfamily)